MKAKEHHILILEDDYKLADEWQATLMGHGHTVDAVTSAYEAKLLLNNEYSCYIIDLYHVENHAFLPDGGIHLIGWVRRLERERGRNPLIIAITGFFRDGDDTIISTGQVAKNLGADVVLQKPSTIDDIVKAMDAW